MAKFNLSAGKTVAELKKEFNEAFGSVLKVYNKNKIADDAATLGELGLKADTEFECRANRTAGSFIAAFAELGLKVKIYTQDEWVAVLDGLTLEATGKVKKNATKADMEGMEGYQREESTDTPEVVDVQPVSSEKKKYRLIIKNPMIATLELSNFCDQDEVRDCLDSDFDGTDPDDIDENFLIDGGYLEEEVEIHNIVTSCDSIEVYDEDGKLLKSVSFDEQKANAEEDELVDTSGILESLGAEEDGIYWLTVRNAVKSADITFTFKKRNYDPEENLDYYFFKEFGIEGIDVDYYPVGNIENEVVLKNQDKSRCYIIEGIDPEVIWED